MPDNGTAAALRFARFKARPEIQRVTARYASWTEGGDGYILNVQLAGLAMSRLAGSISRSDYRASVRKLAGTSGMPLKDFQLLAQCNRELVRCMLSGSGQIAFNPGDWDAEEASL